jgi:hypothetical protein
MRRLGTIALVVACVVVYVAGCAYGTGFWNP